MKKITETRQYLTFKLENEIYAMDVSQVREILEYTNVTRIPQTPPYLKGVINLRGKVVPVIDLRLKFGLNEIEKTINTCIVVIEVSLGEELVVLGVLVDAVQEVIELEPNQIEPPPKVGLKLKTDFIKGMGKMDDKFIIILDVDKVFSAEELTLIQETTT